MGLAPRRNPEFTIRVSMAMFVSIVVKECDMDMCQNLLVFARKLRAVQKKDVFKVDC